MQKTADFIVSLPKNVVLGVIKVYQKTLSPDHGWRRRRFPNGYCRFYPSCSEYSYQAIKKRGLLVGLVKSAWRVLRCNPWSKGGFDPPEDTTNAFERHE